MTYKEWISAFVFGFFATLGYKLAVWLIAKL